MKSAVAVMGCVSLATTMFSTSVNGAENFFSNPTTPYPPGCATNSQAFDGFTSNQSEIFSNSVYMKESNDPELLHEVQVRILRRGCAEQDRALLLFEMTVLDDGDDQAESVPCPEFSADVYGVGHEIRGVTEPNSWMASCQNQAVEEGATVTIFLDGQQIFDEAYDQNKTLTAEEYNGDFNLHVLDPRDHSGFIVGIPEYRNQHQLPDYPLNGRLSGTWVVPGIPDQGFVLAFEELIGENRLHLFLSWYTFDGNGEQLWLVGGARFDLGDTEVTLSVEQVQNGTFLGSGTAETREVGTARIKAFACNQLSLTYNLDQIGLGEGSVALSRIFALEVAGYACRDPAARLDSLD